jgi:hypothetical protein
VDSRGGTREGRRVAAPRFEAVATTHEELEEVGTQLIAEGKKKKLPKLASFGKWLVEDEAPKLASKAQARERAKSRQVGIAESGCGWERGSISL